MQETSGIASGNLESKSLQRPDSHGEKIHRNERLEHVVAGRRMTVAKDEFHEAMIRGPQQLRALGYSPTRFIQMVAEFGGVDAAHALLKGPEASDGFSQLWEMNRLDMSVEAKVLLPWFEELFTNEELRNARRKLEAHRFDVESYLANARLSPPDWA